MHSTDKLGREGGRGFESRDTVSCLACYCQGTYLYLTVVCLQAMCTHACACAFGNVRWPVTMCLHCCRTVPAYLPMTYTLKSHINSV